MQRLISALVIVSFYLTGSFAQKILDFNKLTIDDGFTSSRANVILQDKKGFIWFGTWNGLNRYDGYETEIFKPKYHDSTTISNREVTALLEDHVGNIWIGTTSGLNCYNPQYNSMKRYSFQYRILALYQDEDKKIWVGTNGGGLYLLDPETGEKEHFLGADVISDIYEDSRHIFWIATYQGLLNFDRSSKSYVRFLPERNNPNSLNNNTVTQIVESEDHNLWIGTWGGGLNKMVYNENQDSIKFYAYNNYSGNRSLSANVIYQLYYDNYGNLWAGTWSDGLYLLERGEQGKTPDKALFHSFKHDPANSFSISGNNITALFVDRSGILWVGAANIDRASIIKNGFTRYKTSRLVNGNVQENTVRTLMDVDGKLLVGTSNDLQIYDFVSDRYAIHKSISRPVYSFRNMFFGSSSILDIAQDEQGIWVGTDDAGLILYPGKSALLNKSPRFIFLNSSTTPRLPGNKIGNVVASRKYPGVLWVGTAQSGMAKLLYSNKKKETVIWTSGSYSNSLSDNNVRAVLEDKDGIVWIGTQNGLNRLDPETGFIEKYHYSFSDTGSINDNVINVLFEDSFDNLWIGTNSGLNKKVEYVAKNGKRQIYFKGYPTMNHLDDEIISNIEEDDEGNLWLGLYQGVIKFNILKDTFVKGYFSKDYQRIIINRNTCIKNNSGELIYGGANGFMTMKTDSILPSSVPPRVEFTNIFVFNNDLGNKETAEKYGVDQTIPFVKTLDLSYKDKILRVEFSAMDFKSPKKNTYSYILEGFDEMWNDAGTRNSATYTNISPGEYTFKVRATNSDGIESSEPAELKVIVASPWWNTTFAYIVFGLLLIGLLYFFKQYSIIEVRQKGKIMLEHLQFEKEHELNEVKSRFFTNITHEFRTPLTLIQGPAEELVKNTELPPNAIKQATLIQRNAQRLLRLVNQLMEFRKVEQEKMEVYFQKTNVNEIINDLFESFKSMADSKNINLKLEVPASVIYADVDIDKFEKVLYNLVSNAFKYSEDGGIITLRVFVEETSVSEKSLILEVEDTGIGIEQKYQEKVFEKFFQANSKQTQSTGGIGLFLSKAFVELHGGNIELDSEPGKGSCFRVILPDSHGVEDMQSNDLGISEVSAEEVEQDEVTDNISHTSFTQPKVLVVEDDGELNEFIVSGLEDEFEVVGVYNGREGFDSAKKNEPDLIISDIMMPELDGIEMMKALRKDFSTSHIPVVFLTAKTMREDEILGLKLGAVDYIHKPFNLISLRLKIQNILENRQRIRDKIKADQLLEPEEIELTSLDDKFLKEAVEAVNDNIDDTSFDVEKFSMVIGVSPNKVYRKIKALTGQTAKEFIRNQRLKAAAKMLLQNKRSISEIIYMVGFSSPSYFTRCFREYYGCTPKEYIEKGGDV
ncbi:two-component regulator propeller domain-containing protein [Saccharicrinis sp. FJH62]|uniref:hybrid sensor histidine kinase/response regulator transcription factor n=1 Tax=Saccharicrinis sp. FJH62 TaxID=3344657 RepID=UPI0035D45E1C